MTEQNISFEYYLFKISGNFIKLFYNIDYYIPVSTVLYFIVNQISKCKRKKYLSILCNPDNPDNLDNNIYVNQVYFRNLSPLRKETSKKQLISGINKTNIKNTWKIYKQEFKETPKIGDFIEVNYTVPYEKLNPQYHVKHISYIVTYIYPCNIQFPPYSIKELRLYDRNLNYKNGVLFAYCKDEDFTEKAIKLSGPIGNFYSDLPTRFGIRVTRQILIDNNKNKEELVITDNNGDETKVINDDIIKL
jgi:hypothetical protein